ncbi:ABC transporter permease [Angustibacter aerolatus]
MLRTTLAQLRHQGRRTLSATVAVVIAVAFVVATLVVNATTTATVERAVAAQYQHTDLVVTGDGLDAALPRVARVPGVVAAVPDREVEVAARGRGVDDQVAIRSVAADAGLAWQDVTSGRLPTGAGEVAASDGHGVRVGDRLHLTGAGDAAAGPGTDVRVVGLVDLHGDPTAAGGPSLFATDAQVRALGGAETSQLRLRPAAGADPDAVRSAVRAAAGADATVVTGERQVATQVRMLTGGTVGLTAVLLSFAGLAVVVAGLVIANTFGVLLAQRTRELALLRCIGATSRQVRRTVLTEAFVVGLVASALGAAVGVALAAVASFVVGRLGSPLPLTELSVPPYAVVAGLVVGVVTDVAAAAVPARAATRVRALAALRPLATASVRSRPGVVRTVLGSLALAAGVLVLLLGTFTSLLLVAMAGGALSFVAIVLLGQLFVPPVVGLAGRLARRLGGVPATLAAGNSVRNPRRTAATTTALLVGVTLVSMALVGVASTRATTQAALDGRFPTDVVVTADTDLPPTLPARIESLDGVARVAALPGARVTGPRGEPVRAVAVDHAADPVLRDQVVQVPAAGTAVAPPWLLSTWDADPGDRVTLHVGDRRVQVLVRSDDDAADLLLAPSDLHRLAPAASARALWVRLDGGLTDTDAVSRTVSRTALAAASDAQVMSPAMERDALDSVLDGLLIAVTALLGVAVLIALVGVGNTLALSVWERQQESGLLRALGLPRRGLHRMLLWEAALVSGTASVLGLALGAAYGVAGTAAALGPLGDVHAVLPWGQLLLGVAVATAAGMLASVLPARRAARTPPVAAIAAAT